MTTKEEIPDEWIFVNHLEVRPDSDMTGALYINPTGTGIDLIQIQNEPPHELIRLYEHEVSDLIHSLVDILEEL